MALGKDERMTVKLLGAVCVILGCGGFGFMIAANARREISALRQLISALDFIECDLNYRMPPLAQLCRLAAAITNGCIKRLLLHMAEELDQQKAHSVDKCIIAAIQHCPELPPLTAQRVMELGKSLGKFDLAGQIKCIRGINVENTRILDEITSDHIARFRSYKTLALCAGAALVILLI